MTARSAQPAAAPVALIWGEDEFSVKQRARELYRQWGDELGGADTDLIDAMAANSGEALRALAKLREALQTLPFFSPAKIIWFQDCNFLGEDRTGGAQAVTEALTGLAKEWKTFDWSQVRLLISAGKVSRVRTFYKTLETFALVEGYAGWSLQDRDWAGQAEAWTARRCAALHKDITDEALAELVTAVGPHPRQLASELEKLALYVGDHPSIEVGDVTVLVSRQKQARAFALAEALGDRDLPRVFQALDEELWGTTGDTQKSEIGLLYGLIAKVRTLIFLQELLRLGWVKPERDYNRFKAHLAQLKPDAFPADRRFNPTAINPYVLYKALPQVRRFSQAELIQAMRALLDCNQRLVSSGLDRALILQQTLVRIISPMSPQTRAKPQPNG